MLAHESVAFLMFPLLLTGGADSPALIERPERMALLAKALGFGVACALPPAMEKWSPLSLGGVAGIVACGPLLLRGFAIGAFLEEVEAERFRAV